jgi:hypothetical protein
MPLVEANHQSQPGHPSRMLLAEANHQSQPGRPSWMPLVEANQQSQRNNISSSNKSFQNINIPINNSTHIL